MTEEIFDFMEKRKKYKSKIEDCKKKQKEIKQKIPAAKEKWMKDKCREMKELERKRDTFEMYKKVREFSGLFNRKIPNILVDTTDKPLTDEQNILNTWSSYISELFEDQKPNVSDDMHRAEEPQILKSAVLHGIRRAKSRKATSPGDISVELLQLIYEDTIDILVKFFNSVYDTRETPEEWLKSVFITLSKNNVPKDVTNTG